MLDKTVLSTLRSTLGVGVGSTDFDEELTAHSMAALFDLQLMGVGEWMSIQPVITNTTRWSAIPGVDATNVGWVVEFVTMRVKRAFDPPTSTAQSEAMNTIISDTAWKMNLAAEVNDV